MIQTLFFDRFYRLSGVPIALPVTVGAPGAETITPFFVASLFGDGRPRLALGVGVELAGAVGFAAVPIAELDLLGFCSQADLAGFVNLGLPDVFQFTDTAD